MKNNLNIKTLSLAALGILAFGANNTFANESGTSTSDYNNEKNAVSAYNGKRTPAARDMHRAATRNPKRDVANFSTGSKADVKEVQNALSDIGLYQGPVDGLIGAQTTEAVKAFQRDHRLTVTGRLDSQTITVLGRNNANWSWSDSEMFSE